MTTQRVRQTARGVNRLRERPDVGNEPVASRHQLVQLAARREVLILETRRLTRHWRTEHFRDDLVVDCGEDVANAREKSADTRESVRQRRCARWAQRQRLTHVPHTVEARAVRTAPALRPELIALMLLEYGNLRLRRENNVSYPRGVAEVRGDSGENPSAA